MKTPTEDTNAPLKIGELVKLVHITPSPAEADELSRLLTGFFGKLDSLRVIELGDELPPTRFET